METCELNNCGFRNKIPKDEATTTSFVTNAFLLWAEGLDWDCSPAAVEPEQIENKQLELEL